jgi:hemolysin activation/secretion protein
MIKILQNNSKYILANPSLYSSSTFIHNDFASARAEYGIETVNDKLFPKKGIRFLTGVNFTQNLKETKRSVTNISGIFGFYIPIAPSLTLAVKTGIQTLVGTPEFYQLSKLGGGNTLRGYLRYRFYGKTAAYNQNELQWNFNVRSFLLNGKMGFLALLDNGRVWQPEEKSQKWHIGYGGGIILAPFNKISITATYAVSPEDGRFNVRIGRLF